MNQESVVGDFAIPSNSAVKEATDESYEASEYIELPKNHADEPAFCVAFHDNAFRHFNRFIGQASRDEFMTKLKDADAKFRAAKSRANKFESSSTQNANGTMSGYSSTQFYKTVKLISSGQKSMIFSDADDIPLDYIPLPGNRDYTKEEGVRIANWQKAYLKHVWLQEDWTSLIKKELMLNAKNSMVPWSLDWDKKVCKRPERVPGYYDKSGKATEWNADDPPAEMFDKEGERIEGMFDDKGMPLSYVFVEKERVEKNNPVLCSYDWKDVYMDFDLDDVQDQTLIAVRKQIPLSELIDMQKQGYYKNVEKIGPDQYYQSEDIYADTLKEDRLDNADRSVGDEPNGLVDTMRIWFRASVNESKDSAKWDNNAIPEWWEAVLAGKFGNYSTNSDSGADKAIGAIFLCVRKNPYHHGQNPYFIMHSHDDETGIVRMGHYELLANNVEEQSQTINQWIDNKTLAVWAPWIAEKGNVLSRDLVFRRGNDVKWVKSGTGGTALTKQQVPDLTSRFVPEIQYLESDADRTVGTTEAYKGIAMGARTSRTEYLGAREQALMPAIEDCHTVFDGFGQWLAKGVMKLSRQFADPNETMVVDGEEINPAQLYGELGVKLTGIDKYVATYSARQALISFLQSGGFQAASAIMGKEGALHFFRLFWKYEKLPDADKVFPALGTYVEAENQAWQDYARIIKDPMGSIEDVENLPKQGEMHDVHVKILNPLLQKWQLMVQTMPEEKRPYAQSVVQALKFYIMQHNQLKAQETVVPPASNFAGGMMGGGEMGAIGGAMEPTGQTAGAAPVGMGESGGELPG